MPFCCDTPVGGENGFVGKVVAGDRIGRTIGFPTANLEVDAALPAGVFACRVRTADGVLRKGMLNVGNRPTLNGADRRVEVHIFDFDAEIYGQILEIIPVARLRDEVRFDSLAALQAQLAADSLAARRLLNV